MLNSLPPSPPATIFCVGPKEPIQPGQVPLISDPPITSLVVDEAQTNFPPDEAMTYLPLMMIWILLCEICWLNLQIILLIRQLQLLLPSHTFFLHKILSFNSLRIISPPFFV